MLKRDVSDVSTMKPMTKFVEGTRLCSNLASNTSDEVDSQKVVDMSSLSQRIMR